MATYSKQHFFDNTNAGLDYIIKLYPNYKQVNKNFKLDSDDDTPSGRVEYTNSVYYFYNYREDKKGRNAIDLCMYENNMEFYEALEYLYKDMGLPTLEGKSSVRAEWRREETFLEKEYHNIEYLDKPANLKVFAPFLTPEVCEQYNFRSVANYEFVSYVKDEQGNTTDKKQLNKIIASDEYPIFAFAEEAFVKIYEPLAAKAYRFRFFGKKPHNFIYGWQWLLNKANVDQIKYLRKKISEEDNAKAKKALQDELNEELLNPVFIASGGSDGLNLASLGFNVIWFNSETEQINYEDYQLLKTICKGVYNVPDVDGTGVKMAVKLGLLYLDLKTVWLPLDYEVSKKKDFRDWIAQFKQHGRDWVANKFQKLVDNALAFKWWEWNKTGSNYRYNYVNLLYFLEHQGFYVFRIQHRNQQQGKIENIFIKITGHVAREVHPSDIKVYLQDWLKENEINLNVRNMVISSRGINSEQLLSLPRKSLDYRLATRSTQYFFFNNKAVLITHDSIKEVKPEDLGIIIWDNKVIKHNIQLDKAPQFSIAKDAQGNWDIIINEKNNKYFNYLINASRVHWQAELEKPFGEDLKRKEEYHAAHLFDIAGPNLSPEEIAEQKQHLVNKIYTLGYLLHGFKNSTKPWAVVAIDNKIPDEAGESNGRSGKSLFLGSALDYFKNRVILPGRDPKTIDNQFLYDELTEQTEVVFIDDAHYSFPYNRFFTEITGSTKVNKKHGLQFEIPFEQSPKFAFSTNYLPKGLDGSTLGRMLITVFSDYYHTSVDGSYNEDRSPSDELGGMILKENYSPLEEFNMFFNFCMQAVQFFIQCNEKIEAPKGNIQIRNYMQIMGDSFHEWAKSYFLIDDAGVGENLNKFIDKGAAMDAYKKFVGGKSTMTPQRWKKALEAFCKLPEQAHWELNPKGLRNAGERILHAVYDPATQKNTTSKECIYINTTGEEITRQGTAIVRRGKNGTVSEIQQPAPPAQQTDAFKENDLYQQTFGEPGQDPELPNDF